MKQMNLFDTLTTQKNLTNELNDAAKAYYSEDKELMSDKEYDAKYDQLVELEQASGTILPDSPTQRVGYEVVSGLKKVQHEYPALSLDKTKDRESLVDWLKGKEGVVSWKMDGLTGVATYEKGLLKSFVTRGNGQIGEDVTHNAAVIKGLPLKIAYKGKLVVRGEAVISYKDFDVINSKLPEDQHYKNPRNLASGSLRLLDASKAKDRCMVFKAFTYVYSDNMPTTITESFEKLTDLGFDVVEYTVVTPESIVNVINDYEKRIITNNYPSDGLVIALNDIAYGISLGSTGKFPKHSIAFKWKDETAISTLREIEWSASQTGLLNPVAIFDPVELEGTTVTRASLHNVSYIQDMNLQVGNQISIYKSNMIIPQLAENLDKDSQAQITAEQIIVSKCPVCGEETKLIRSESSDTLVLKCINSNCAAKHIGKFTRLVERDALNVTGLAEAIIREFIGYGWLKNLSDIFSLQQYKDKIIALDGFGEKSFNNMVNSLESARNTTFKQFFYSLCIPDNGHDVSKILEKYFSKDASMTKTMQLRQLLEKENATEVLKSLDGIGEVRASKLTSWWNAHSKEALELLNCLVITDDVIKESSIQQDLLGKTFVITGSLTTYANRDELKAEIESRGGKVSGSVSKNTSYLINNDVTSTSGKNKKAKELNVPIISEAEYKLL